LKDHRTLVAVTRAVQDFRAYRRRDVGRPVRDLERGMVPPKLAQVLLNLAGVGVGSQVLDPFCGTGTVLQEALLAGAAHVIGRDIDPRAVGQATENLRWLEGRRPELRSRWTVRTHDARLPDPALGAGQLDAVVFEPTLGPLRPPRERTAQLRLAGELVQLYERSLAAIAPLLRPGGKVAAVLPTFSAAAATAVEPPASLRRVALLPEVLVKPFGLLSRYEVLYRRPDQTVGRAVVAWEKS
jgi:tRNA G10  N-methylase Trm11